MAVKFKRPLLVGGLSLTLALWVLDTLQQSIAELGGLALIGTIATGAGFWWLRKRLAPVTPKTMVPTKLERAIVEQAIADVDQAIANLELEYSTSPAASGTQSSSVAPLREKWVALSQDLDRSSITVMVMGGKATGKTTLVNLLSKEKLAPVGQLMVLKDTDALFTKTQVTVSSSLALPAVDLILFLTAGDLTDPEFQTLNELAYQRQRLLLLCNKQDQYLPDERVMLLQRSRQRMQQIVDRLDKIANYPYAPLPLPINPTTDVMAVMTNPGPVKVRQHQADGSIQEWLETPVPEVTELIQYLQTLLTQESQTLIWATILRSTITLKGEVQTELNQIWRDRAMQFVEQFQWIAAAAAFANPVPILDLLATSVVTAQLVMELGQIYKQKFSLQQAQVIAGVLANLLVSLGLVELSTQLIGAVFKGNAVTYVAGGVIQGASAAYLTRLAGLTLMEYFHDRSLTVNLQAENPLTIEGLQQKLQAIFQENRQLSILQALAQQTLGHIFPSAQATLS